MKTAMQTLLDDIEFLMPEIYKALNKKFELKKFYLKQEKQQIIDSVNSQRQIGWDEKGEEYYIKTYKSE
jgi:hypothetical protein